jgi:hypothetical protein
VARLFSRAADPPKHWAGSRVRDLKQAVRSRTRCALRGLIHEPPGGESARPLTRAEHQCHEGAVLMRSSRDAALRRARRRTAPPRRSGTPRFGKARSRAELEAVPTCRQKGVAVPAPRLCWRHRGSNEASRRRSDRAPPRSRMTNAMVAEPPRRPTSPGYRAAASWASSASNADMASSVTAWGATW